MTRGISITRTALTKTSKSPNKRYLIIPDTQVEPGVDIRHMDWAAQAIVEYRPDVIVHIGDHWDMHSLSSYDRPGSKFSEGARIADDIEWGNEAMVRLVTPALVEQARLRDGKRKQWNPEWHFFTGNHEQRIERAVNNEPKYEGLLSYEQLWLGPFKRHPFLEIVELDGILFSHYFANVHSGRPIGGSVDNRLNKVGKSFVQGHEQGLLYGLRQFPGSLTRHGLVAGSFYLHDPAYRGAQGNGEWRGIVVLNEVNDGSYDIMPLSMKYLEKKYS